jgi:hypothetical protein
VEAQLRSNDPPQTQQIFKRLIEAGISEQETKRLIACVISAAIFDVLKQQQPFNLERFVKSLGQPSSDALGRRELTQETEHGSEILRIIC